jgi:hypothetical protein
MNLPRLDQIQTKEGKVWRITAAGMVKYHRQEWQARCIYHQFVMMYAGHLAAED